MPVQNHFNTRRDNIPDKQPPKNVLSTQRVNVLSTPNSVWHENWHSAIRRSFRQSLARLGEQRVNLIYAVARPVPRAQSK